MKRFENPNSEKETPPILPLFVQMNEFFTGKDNVWRETARWVKFIEDVEICGTKWSKPYVPSIQLTSLMELKSIMNEGNIILNGSGSTINEILDSITEYLPNEDILFLKELCNQRVKLKMKLNLAGKISSQSIFLSSTKNSTDNTQNENDFILNKEKSKKMRNHNLFLKKVPKNVECCNILAATCHMSSYLSSPKIIFIRLNQSVLLENFCEIPSPTKFLAIILGNPQSDKNISNLGRALGMLMSDEIFPKKMYEAKRKQDILDAIESYTEDVTILPPSAWDPKIRLDPPKSFQTLEQRLSTKNLYNSNRTNIENEESELDAFLPDEYENDESYLKDNGLVRTGKLFGGLIGDIKRKKKWIKSDFIDAFHIQAVASIIYIYLATITKAITFGGFLGDITNGLQGVLESFLGHALAGGVFCLFAGQPLTVLGCTGPVLIFEKILIDICESYAIEYLTFRLWIGIWSALFCLFIVAFDLSAFVQYFTRFTEESFATLIAVIFIVEALKKLEIMSKYYQVYTGYNPQHITFEQENCRCIQPDNFSYHNITENKINYFQIYNLTHNGTSLNNIWNKLTKNDCLLSGGQLSGNSCQYVPDIFLLSVILFTGTFFLSLQLKKIKCSPYFPAKIRSLLSDYAVIVSIFTFVGVDQIFALDTPKLIVPTEFKPTRSDLRSWIIPFTHDSIAWYFYLLAAIPALLLTILLFMDQQITSIIVNRKEHKLKKGFGYHLDMLIVGLMLAVTSILGLPWCVAATVLCLGHVDSLKMETETSAPGERPRFLGVREQRVTGVMVFILTGLSVKLAPILKYIPMPVLYGVLMYMGVSALKGMQFIDRIHLFFIPVKYQPDFPYLRTVSLRKVHFFTIIQILALISLWAIKSTSASLIFPLMVLALVAIRKGMDLLFSQSELFWLDNIMPNFKEKTTKSKKEKKITNISKLSERETKYF